MVFPCWYEYFCTLPLTNIHKNFPKICRRRIAQRIYKCSISQGSVSTVHSGVRNACLHIQCSRGFLTSPAIQSQSNSIKWYLTENLICISLLIKRLFFLFIYNFIFICHLSPQQMSIYYFCFTFYWVVFVSSSWIQGALHRHRKLMLGQLCMSRITSLDLGFVFLLFRWCLVISRFLKIWGTQIHPFFVISVYEIFTYLEIIKAFSSIFF